MFEFLILVKYASIVSAIGWISFQSRKPQPRKKYIWTIGAVITIPYCLLYFLLQVHTPQSQNPFFLGFLTFFFILAVGYTIDLVRLRTNLAKSWSERSKPSPTITSSSKAPRQESGNDVSIYAQIATEMETGDVNKGLWLKARVESNGDLSLAEVAYTKLRYKELSDRDRMVRKQPESVAPNEVLERVEDIDDFDVHVCPSCSHLNRLKKGLSRDLVCEYCNWSWDVVVAKSSAKNEESLLSAETQNSKLQAENDECAESEQLSMPTNFIYQMHRINCSDFGFMVEGESFDSIRNALNWIDGKTFRARTVIDKDHANIIEKIVDLNSCQDRSPLIEKTLKSELKKRGYLVISLPNGGFRVEYRSVVVPAGNSITDLRAILETHQWREENYKTPKL